MTFSPNQLAALGGFATLLVVLAFWLGRLLGRSQQQAVAAAERSALGSEKTRFETIASRVPKLEEELRATRGALDAAEQQVAALSARLAERDVELREAEKSTVEKLELLAINEARMRESFQSLSLEALERGRAAFIDQAQATFGEFRESALRDFASRETAFSELVTPIRESLTKFQSSVHDLEQKRGEAYVSITEQFTSLKETQSLLKGETERLVAALRSPTVRGRWGELQLRRVVELAGMVEHCDFEEQHTIEGDDGRLRPDLIVHLPGGKTVVVDAKVALQAYLDARDARTDDERRQFVINHARQMRAHVENLGSKAYWNQLESSPDFVVMYVPLESAFSDALSADPSLLEDAITRGVIPAGPMTLLSLLKGAGYGWRQERIAKNAEQISELGKELHDRLATLAGHFESVGESLGKATLSYNKAVASMESRVLVSARKFKELGATAGEDIPEVETVSVAPRQLAIPGLEEESGDDREGLLFRHTRTE